MMTRVQKPRIGGHVSAAGKARFALERGEAIGAELVQIFGSSPRSWAVKPISKEDAAEFRLAHKKSSIGAVYLHGSYLVNLGTPDQILLERSRLSLIAELTIAEAIGATGLIFHVGSLKGQTKDATDQIVGVLTDVLKKVPGQTPLLLENAAGGGEKIGSHPRDFEPIYKKMKSPRIKFCIDTAHAFEAGMIEQYEPLQIKALFKEWDNTVGVENVLALHVNDSKTLFNSRHDRHENIGKGYIGLAGFKNLAKDKIARELDWILEVPGFENTGPDKKNVDILKSCR